MMAEPRTISLQERRADPWGGGDLNVLTLYNEYRSPHGGESVVVEATLDLLRKHGARAALISRSSKGLSPAGKVRAFGAGVYSFSAYRQVAAALASDRPDIVHVHNLYPFLSPSVLVACRRAGVPTVMSVHNYSLTCPHWAHLYKGQICERCLGGREYWCVLQNCQENIFESIGYALRGAVARKLRLFHDNVTVVIALTEFAKRRLIDAGFKEDRIEVLPNMVAVRDEPVGPASGGYVAFAGRLSAEKGVDTLLAAARRLPEIPVRLAGGGPLKTELGSRAPDSARFVGVLDAEQMAAFYRGARFVVLPSTWYEMCPLVISEAMSHGLPVIASRIGGLPELVDDGRTGLLFEPGNPDDLADKIGRLWTDAETCRRMGQAGREKAVNQYGEACYWTRLLEVYAKAKEIHAGQSA